MEREKIEALLTPFKSKVLQKESLHHIGSVDWGGNHVFASDAYVLALIPTDWVPEFPEHLKRPNIIDVLPTRWSDNPITLDIQSMYKVMSEIPYDYTEIGACAVCDDTGEFMIGSESYDCKSCSNRGNYVIHERSKSVYIEICQHIFSANVLEKIVHFIALLNEGNVSIISPIDDNRKGMVFKLNSTDIILMAMPVYLDGFSQPEPDTVFKIQ